MGNGESVFKDQTECVDETAGVTEDPKQSSPARRARRLEKSRDNWKAKIKENKHQIKALKIKARDLGLSRQNWKVRAKQAEAKLKEAMDMLAQQGSGEDPKKNQE